VVVDYFKSIPCNMEEVIIKISDRTVGLWFENNHGQPNKKQLDGWISFRERRIGL
jgi:hypothetical protein